MEVCRECTHAGAFCKLLEYILITKRFHVAGKDRGKCALNRLCYAARKRGNADAERGGGSERASGLMRI